MIDYEPKHTLEYPSCQTFLAGILAELVLGIKLPVTRETRKRGFSKQKHKHEHFCSKLVILVCTLLNVVLDIGNYALRVIAIRAKTSLTSSKNANVCAAMLTPRANMFLFCSCFCFVPLFALRVIGPLVIFTVICLFLIDVFYH